MIEIALNIDPSFINMICQIVVAICAVKQCKRLYKKRKH